MRFLFSILRLIAFPLILAISPVRNSVAQNNQQQSFEDFKKQATTQYNNFRQAEENGFRTYRDSLNREYRQYRDSLVKTLKKYRDSTNVEFGRRLKQAWQKQNTRPPAEPSTFQYTPFYKRLNSEYPRPSFPKSGNSDFYGKTLNFSIPGKTVFHMKGVTEEEVSRAWLHLNECDLTALICDCLLVARDMNLNGWGYYQMVHWLSDRIFPIEEENEKVVFRFFMLKQSGYKCRIAATEKNKLILLLPFNAQVYRKSYQEYDGLLYYLMDDSGMAGILSSYVSEFPDSSKIPDLYLRNPLKIGVNTVYKEFSTPALSSKIKLPINKHRIEFYNDYPFCQLDVYAQSQPHLELDKAVREQFKPLLTASNAAGKVAQLQHFMHTAFHYRPDQDYWKKERYFFPEEGLFYPYMDCEDYAVLFRYLVRTLTGSDVVLILYPDHVSTAVCLSQDVKTGYIVYHGKKYTLCDPSYTGSNPGQVMPRVQGVKYRVME